MRLVPGAAAGLVLALTAGCGAASTPGRHGQAAATHVTAASTSPATSDSGQSGHLGRGELAFIAYRKLYLLGGRAGAPRWVALPGIPYAPAWSADHRWLAVEVSKPPPASQPYLQVPTTLWLVNSAGTSERQLTSAAWQISAFAWAPRADQLAVTAYLPRAPQSRSYLAATVSLAGRSRTLTTGGYLTGPAWSPDGRQVAVGIGVFANGRWSSEIQVVSATGARLVVLTSSRVGVLEVAAWWPDDAGLLYWFNPQGSASIAADGLPLDSVPLRSRHPREIIPTMLVHGSWLAFSPAGNAVAAVAGDYRVIWSGGKHVTICSQSGGCTPVAQPDGVVSLDPSWSPGGTIAFARLSASGPFGPDGHADFSPYWIRRWEATSRLWTVDASGSDARPLTAAGQGAVDPTWGSDGSLLFVRNDSLWLLPPGAPTATRLTGPLGALSGLAYDRTYYAYVPYPQLFAWTLAASPQTATGT